VCSSACVLVQECRNIGRKTVSCAEISVNTECEWSSRYDVSVG
jgi:hypothetical protein